MESMDRSFRVRIAAPAVYRISKDRASYSQGPIASSLKVRQKPASLSPKKSLLGASNYKENLKAPHKVELPPLSTEQSTIHHTHRSRSLSRGSKTETSSLVTTKKNSQYINSKDKIISPEFSIENETKSCNPSPERVISTTPMKNHKVLILEPIYSKGRAVVLFNYPAQCYKASRVNSRVKGTNHYNLYFNVSSNVHTYNSVVNSFIFAGFSQNDKKFNVLITGVPKVESIRELNIYQKLNHFPASKQLGRKDNLWKNLNAMRRKHGSEYEICPKTYLIPEDYDALSAQMEKKKKLWIMKPAAASCGRGIKVTTNISDIPKKNRYVVSKYISSPHTINGFKYDLRVYVAVTSFDPLRIYIYQEGLVRFATEQYVKSKKSLKKRYIHLTNFSVNKRSKDFIKVQSDTQDGEGSKWSFTALRKKFNELQLDFDLVFAKIEDIIIKTLIAVEPHMVSSLCSQKYRNTCFELYGFDVLIDSNMKPWLLEVNILPSLSSSSPMDKKIKTSLMCDILTLIGVVPYKKSDLIDKPTKNPYRNLPALQACSLLEDYLLSEDDLQILVDCEEENYRLGSFKKIFPLKKNVDYYAGFLPIPRYNNTLLWKHIKSYFNIVSKFCQKHHPSISV